jgi:wobble nucleotide-excising tRNase
VADPNIQKYKNPFDPDLLEMTEVPENYSNLLNNVIDKLNKIISEHNQRIKNHYTEVLNAKEKLELNSIAIALSEQDYKKYISDLKEAESKEKESLEKLNKINFDILELEKSTSNIGIAIKKINKHLKEFFGREEIKLELDDNKKGYVIKRDGQLAKNLSEGEKTAIAFSYFIVKVEEKEFKIKEGLIFIDDPISSFDSNFIYHCFSLIKNHFSDIGQLFISTHNFQLFNLVKDWFVSKNKNTEEKNMERKLKGQEEKEIPCEFYMVRNDTTADKRTAKLIALDKTLKDFKSEYTFLFSLLKEFNEKTEDPEFEEIYNIANIGRRFFDIYADFKIPTNSKQPKDKICLLVDQINESKGEDEKISKVVCDKVFWLINGFSHNFDPTSVIEHKDKNEVKEAIKILLNIVKESDHNHYKILEDNIK